MKILSNKKYRELLLKSCKGMFGAVTNDMLLRSNAFLAKEKEQIQDELQRKDNNWNELKEFILNHYIVGHTVQNGSLDMIINKMKELESGE